MPSEKDIEGMRLYKAIAGVLHGADQRVAEKVIEHFAAFHIANGFSTVEARERWVVTTDRIWQIIEHNANPPKDRLDIKQTLAKHPAS